MGRLEGTSGPGPPRIKSRLTITQSIYRSLGVIRPLLYLLVSLYTWCRSVLVSLALLMLAVAAHLNVSLMYGAVLLPAGYFCVALPQFIPITQVDPLLQLHYRHAGQPFTSTSLPSRILITTRPTHVA